MATRVLNRPKRLRVLLALALAAALAAAAGTAGIGRASAESPSCTLTAPAQLTIDKPYQQFSVTRSCTGDAPPEITWTASAGTVLTSDAWFLQRTTGVGDVYSDDPMGTWTWKVTDPGDRPDVVFNEPVTDVRLKSVATGAGVWNAVDGTTKITFHVTRYNPATNTTIPWAGATGTLEFHTSPYRGEPPFTTGTALTANSNGDVVLTVKPTIDMVYRFAVADAPTIFGSRTGNVLARGARICC
ncbi:hypothetical protein ACIA58_17835 [Kribbella sp. NPDC051586]|uniref:hypothetical protein n=1 Tax=Kribbella sp. NPDC051586 TaxID=3364118 RepID=UPI0037993156